jgi:hypothetical protein
MEKQWDKQIETWTEWMREIGNNRLQKKGKNMKN